MPMAGSIGVIGGADGPTAIYIASHVPRWLLLLPLAVQVIAAASSLIYNLLRARRKQHGAGSI